MTPSGPPSWSRPVRRTSPRTALRGIVLALALAPGVAMAQPTPPSEGGLIPSLGQPPVWKWYGGLAMGRSTRQPDPSFLLLSQAGVLRDVTNPVVGLFAVAGELYGGRAESAEYGLRAIATSPLLGISIGLDASGAHGELRPLLRARAPVRRGGFVTRGGEVRLTWVPGRSLTAGLSVPVRQPTVGRTRPRKTHIRLREREPATSPGPVHDPASARALADAQDAARRIAEFAVPFLDHGGRRDVAMSRLRDAVSALADTIARLESIPPADPAPIAQVRRFHDALAEAFGRAAVRTPFPETLRPIPDAASRPNVPSDRAPEVRPTATGEEVSRTARALALRHVLFPYNRLLGVARHKDTTREFAWSARGPFIEWVVTRSGIPEERHQAVVDVFEAYLAIIEATRRQISDTWDDARLSWIPLQLALLPEEHDEQHELDRIVSGAVDGTFTEGNRIRYLSNEQWQHELLASVQRAEDYHVLWVHDIKAENAAGRPDAVTFRYVVEGYLRTLTRRVREYDRTGRLPVFMIFIDQYYYELHDTRSWLRLLERPLHEELRLGSASAGMQSALDDALRELELAVAGSRLLQRQASQYGREWLENRVKVHVSITNPADPSFWGNQLFPIFSLPDNLMRDHRKLAFHDVTEEDPYRGAALFGGMGIGEHYVGPAWEDRGILVRGPAALGAKQAALELLRSQGFDEDELPYPLRPRTKPPDYDEIVSRTAAAERGGARVLQIHNHTGYLPKTINVAKAALYTLMPPGSIIIIPDSLWNSELWAAMLVGSCLRGVQVLVISPSRANAPGADGMLAMARNHELLERLLIVRRELGDRLARFGGGLQVGLYDARLDVTDVTSRALAALDGIEQQPWVRRLLPLSPEADSLLADADRLSGGLLATPDASRERPRPLLHAKIQLFATREAWEVLRRPELAVPLRAGLGGAPLSRPGAADAVRRRSDPDAGTLVRVFDRYMEETARPERERAALFLMVGSSNQDYRSILLDGEVAILVSGRGAARALPDFVSFLGLATWIEDRDALDRALPRRTGLRWRMSRLLRKSIE